MEIRDKNNIENKSIIKDCTNINAIEQIVKVLKIFNISKIISIDDYWLDEQVEVELENLISHITDFEFKDKVERIRSNEDILDIQELKEGIDNNEYSIEDNEILKRFYKEYVELQENTKEPTLVVLDKVLIELKNKYSDFEIIRQNKQLSNNDIEKYKKNNNLFILDRNMSKSNGSRDSILDSILELKKENDSNLILVYSNECKNDFDTQQNKIKLLDERNICNDEEQISIIYQLWAINKTTNFEEFLQQFVENLYNCAFGKSMYNILETRNNAIKDVFKEMKKEDIQSYIPMFEAAYIEGDTIISGYSKMIDALYNKYMSKRYYEDIKESYKFLIDFEKSKIKSSSEIKAHKESEGKYRTYRLQHVKKQMRNIIKNNERYRIADYIINKLYKDISLGDIIVYREPNNNMKFGIVISRECDCVIRLNKVKEVPKRVLDEYTVLLLKDSEITEELINNLDDRDYIGKCILPINYDGKLYSLMPTEKVRQFDTFILDLCSLNNNGQASIDYKQDFKNYKSFHSEIYYNSKFKDYIKAAMSKYDDYNYIAKEENVETLKNELVSYNYGVKFENNIFKLKRICRLESKRTVLMIQNYIHNISLVGADTPIVNKVLSESDL